MIPFTDYKKATNAAYKLLVERDLFSLATNVFAILGQLENCRVYTYSQVNFLYGTPLDTLLAASEYGFSIQESGQRIIYYNEKMPLGCIRFTLAHELGHAVLGHQDEDDPIAEREANCFARNLLCPIPIVNALELSNSREYVSVFNVSSDMARVARNYYNSDVYYIDPSYEESFNDRIYAFHLGYDSWSDFEQSLLA